MKKRRYDDSSAYFEENEELELAIDEDRQTAREYYTELARRQSGYRGLLLSDETEDYHF